jgi:hypothetical protein
VSPGLIAVSVLAALVVGSLAVHAIRSAIVVGGGDPDRSLPRPWWGNPVMWVAVSVAAVFLGVVVAPHFLGGVIFFIPLLWLSRPRIREHRGHGGEERPGR